jgi:hypothetical protein
LEPSDFSDDNLLYYYYLDSAVIFEVAGGFDILLKISIIKIRRNWLLSEVRPSLLGGERKSDNQSD